MLKRNGIFNWKEFLLPPAEPIMVYTNTKVSPRKYGPLNTRNTRVAKFKTIIHMIRML